MGRGDGQFRRVFEEARINSRAVAGTDVGQCGYTQEKSTGVDRQPLDQWFGLCQIIEKPVAVTTER